MLHRNHRAGFTLIELLVVIAIIAILAAILFPVFATARAKARQINGLSDTKQVSLSILMYDQDFDGDFPMSGWHGTSRGDGTTNNGTAADGGTLEWSNVVGPYIKSGEVVTDPADSSKYTGGPNPVNGNHSILINDLLSHNPAKTNVNAFGDNNWNGNGSPPENIQVGKGENTVNAPADCVLVMEGHCPWGHEIENGSKSYDGFQTTDKAGNKFFGENNISQYSTANITGTAYSGWHYMDGLPIHSGHIGTNAAFVDGHAKFVRVQDGNGNQLFADTLPFRQNIDPTQAGMGNGDWKHRALNSGADGDNWE